jgi:4-hydroxythreonine-4-phosphate dehydrogenase
MVKKSKPVIGVTLGDAAGIGPELIAGAAAKGALTAHARPLIVGDNSLLRLGMKITGVDFEYRLVSDREEILSGETLNEGIIYVLDTKSVDVDGLRLGKVSGVNGKEEGDRLVDCVNFCGKELMDGFCFAPLNKGAMKAGGYNFSSEHELFADCYGLETYHSEMNLLDTVWNIRVTSHIPLRDVAKEITVENILKVSELGYETLKKAGHKSPRFAIAALNPHAGDNGTCGDEEITVIAEAVRLLREKNISVEGPFSADTVFIRAFRGDFNGVITMYHDQGQIAIKLKGFEHTVTISAGMPHPITTPAHGTAYDIAGKGIAGLSTFEDAYRLCAEMASRIPIKH